MKIKDVEEQLQISAHALRYYEKVGLIQPARDSNGYRQYSQNDIEILKKIRFLRELDMSIEDISNILNHSKQFQEILANHISSLQLQIQSLKALQDICVDLKNKDIPLLDAIVEENINVESQKPQLKTIFQKIIDYMKPIETICIGTRASFRDLVGGYFMMIPFILLMTIGLVIGIPHLIQYMNDQLVIAHSQIHIPVYPSNMLTTLLSMMLSIMTLWGFITMNITHQNYIELTDQMINICHLKYQSRYSILLGLLKKDTHQRNRCYHYEQITRVQIKLAFSTTASRGGVFRIYSPKFIFHFQDGEIYETYSGMTFGDNARMAYRILLHKEVVIDIEPLVKEYFEQTEKAGYEFFEEHYRYNTPKNSHKLGGM